VETSLMGPGKGRCTCDRYHNAYKTPHLVAMLH
jgi:hypothetical protein